MKTIITTKRTIGGKSRINRVTIITRKSKGNGCMFFMVAIPSVFVALTALSYLVMMLLVNSFIS